MNRIDFDSRGGRLDAHGLADEAVRHAVVATIDINAIMALELDAGFPGAVIIGCFRQRSEFGCFTSLEPFGWLALAVRSSTAIWFARCVVARQQRD